MEEFHELHETFQTEARASLFLFCELVVFEDNGLGVLGETYTDIDDLETLKRLFRKAKKKAFEDTTSPDLARKLIWFCCQKLFFLKTSDSSLVLDRSTRRELLLLADMYIERT